MFRLARDLCDNNINNFKKQDESIFSLGRGDASDTREVCMCTTILQLAKDVVVIQFRHIM